MRRAILPAIMIANGVLFVIGTYVIGDTAAAIEMHEDLAPTASPLMVHTKVIIAFVVGLLYLIAAFGILRGRHRLALAGVIGFALFDGFYVVELVMWARTNPGTWIGFCTFGSVSLLIGTYSGWVWRRAEATRDSERAPARRVDNDIYRRLGHAWWADDVGEFSSLRFWINPVRFGYFARVLEREKVRERGQRKVLDVGCGGGLLAEEFARAGFQVTGVDPAPETIETARTHASASGLSIEYQIGVGEDLPFPDASFDHVVCCDVLEHVENVDRVVREISRVLRPGGLFFYDTVNRTMISKLAIIKVMQEWKATAFAAPNSHVWEKFIKPRELVALFGRHGLEQRELRGIAPRRGALRTLLDFRRRALGKLTFEELGQRLQFQESDHLETSYMGYAERQMGSSP